MYASVSFEDFRETCKEYEKDEKYVYKKCNNLSNRLLVWLVVMEKSENTKTNEERKDVVDKNHAKFRADELKVVDIINVIDPQRVTTSTQRVTTSTQRVTASIQR